MMKNKNLFRFLSVTFISVLMISLLSVISFAVTYTCTNPRLVDDANLLSASEQSKLVKILDKYSRKLSFDIVVVTKNSIGNETAMEYAADYYDENGYGFSENHDGVLLLISMENRDYWISTYGYGIEAIDDYDGISYIEDEMLGYLSDGYYYDAFMAYAEASKELVENAIAGYDDNSSNDYYYEDDDIDVSDYVSSETNYAMMPLFVSVIAGFIISLIIVLAMKGKLKSVRHQTTASGYIVPGSMKLESSYERFLYRNVTRTKIETDNNTHNTGSHSGGFSGGHISSSGTSHGGGGGHF